MCHCVGMVNVIQNITFVFHQVENIFSFFLTVFISSFYCEGCQKIPLCSEELINSLPHDPDF